MSYALELGLDTFGDVTVSSDGSLISQAQALRNVVEEAVLAESVGVDCFGVGEHHRADFAVSAPEVVLAAIAGRTTKITLGSAVTVLSTDDPVRVFQRFSTLNALSKGRAEVILGRGSFTESYPLFGYDLSQYEELFETKLARFAGLLKGAQVVYPPVEQGTLRTWVGVGGSPESVIRAARHGLPLTLAIIGGSAERFRPFVDLYHQSLAKFGKQTQPVAVHSPGPEGALCVGSPETVSAKIARTIQSLGLARFDMKYSAGTLPHQTAMASIELYGTTVAPMVRERLSKPR